MVCVTFDIADRVRLIVSDGTFDPGNVTRDTNLVSNLPVEATAKIQKASCCEFSGGHTCQLPTAVYLNENRSATVAIGGHSVQRGCIRWRIEFESEPVPIRTNHAVNARRNSPR